MKFDLKIGADPEIFLKEKGTNVHVPAYNIIPGNKKNPYKVKDGAVQVDGLAVEFNINPASSREEFTNNVLSVMQSLQEMLPKNLEFSRQISVGFPVKTYNELPKEAKEIGCDPSLSAYSSKFESPYSVSEEHILYNRSVGGHIHIGWTENADIKDIGHLDACRELTKQLDCYVGLPCLLFENSNFRRNYFGLAGEYRPKPYGVEYRTPSNFWIWDTSTINMVYNQTVAAFNDFVYNDIFVPDKINSFMKVSTFMNNERIYDSYFLNFLKRAIQGNSHRLPLLEPIFKDELLIDMYEAFRKSIDEDRLKTRAAIEAASLDLSKKTV
jgi:hypothetical protein